ncbi:MAG: trypsin-like peptidase domain-containing protein [Clostridia bacterium]|nr:trypsin-like peptidase domain-containing protein [Clostridia bacterium]
MKKHLLGYVAIALVCMMVGSTMTLVQSPTAQAEETTVVVTSPFTAAIAEVRDSVVGVNNYQTVRYSNGNSYGLDDFFDSFGFGGFGGFGGYGNGYGNGYGSSRGIEEQVQEVLAGTGSGVVVGEGYVLTNFHVVEDATRLEISVKEEGKEEPTTYASTLVAYDENLDVAVIYAPELKLTPVKLGNSDSLQVGDWAICIGNPLSEQFTGTVTVGIVSALDRAVSSTNYDKYGRKETITNTMIQTDAAINSGNSGGGMFSVNGELMGIPTLKYTGSVYSGATVEGIGMCIPINAAKPIIEDVLNNSLTQNVSKTASSAEDTTNSNSLVGKPRMGVSVSNINPNYSLVMQGLIPKGVLVNEVDAGSPAETAGILPGDIIVDVNDTVITHNDEINAIIRTKTVGDTLKVKVYRAEGMLELMEKDTINAEDVPDGEYVDLEVVLAIVDQVKQ